jgi:hypothetical protein
MGQMETPPPPSAPAQGTSVFDGLLTQCRDLTSKQLDQAIAGMLEKADAALAEMITKTQNRDQQKLYLEVQEAARKQRAAIEKRFHSSFLTEFKQRTKKGKKTEGKFADFDPEASSFELSLVGDDDLEETLKFNEMAAKLRRICDDEMAALDQRVGVLLGDADLQSESNPLGPNAICDAYKNTCRKEIEGVAIRAVFLKLFDDHVVDAVRSIYKALNDLLVQNAILPKIRYGVSKKDEGKKGKKVKVKGDKDAPDADDEDDDEGQDVFAALQKLFAGQGGGGGGGGGPGGGGGAPGMGVGGVPMIAGAELLGSLTKLQIEGLAALGERGVQIAAASGPLAGGAPITATTNVLQELKSTEVGSSMGQMDAMTLDVVAMLFDQLFDDAKIPLGRQGPDRPPADPDAEGGDRDKTFFSNKEHPARLLLEKLGEIAERLPADFNTQKPAVRPPGDHPAGADHRLPGRRRDLQHRARPARAAHGARRPAHRGGVEVRRRARAAGGGAGGGEERGAGGDPLARDEPAAAGRGARIPRRAVDQAHGDHPRRCRHHHRRLERTRSRRWTS